MTFFQFLKQAVLKSVLPLTATNPCTHEAEKALGNSLSGCDVGTGYSPLIFQGCPQFWGSNSLHHRIWLQGAVCLVLFCTGNRPEPQVPESDSSYISITWGSLHFPLGPGMLSKVLKNGSLSCSLRMIHISRCSVLFPTEFVCVELYDEIRFLAIARNLE